MAMLLVFRVWIGLVFPYCPFPLLLLSLEIESLVLRALHMLCFCE